jgi:hypothetical protein
MLTEIGQTLAKLIFGKSQGLTEDGIIRIKPGESESVQHRVISGGVADMPGRPANPASHAGV